MSNFILTTEELPKDDSPVVIVYYNELAECDCLAWDLYRFNGKHFYHGGDEMDVNLVKAWLPIPKYPCAGLD